MLNYAEVLCMTNVNFLLLWSGVAKATQKGYNGHLESRRTVCLHRHAMLRARDDGYLLPSFSYMR